MSNNEFMLKGKVILKGVIKLETGMHIGGTTETLKIGGTDTPIIKDAFGRVYIPGSSLKGKIRSLLEISGHANNGLTYKKGEDGNPCGCGTCNICKMFGAHKPDDNIKDNLEPRRVIVRDAYLIKKVKDNNGNIKCNEVEDKTEIRDYLETKAENIIDRVSGKAISPRQIERVVKGSLFNFEVIFDIYKEEDYEFVNTFLKGIRLLEDDYLGGSGSRGYGKVVFENLDLVGLPITYYEGGDCKEIIKNNDDGEINIESIKEIVSKIINTWDEWKKNKTKG